MAFPSTPVVTTFAIDLELGQPYAWCLQSEKAKIDLADSSIRMLIRSSVEGLAAQIWSLFSLGHSHLKLLWFFILARL